MTGTTTTSPADDVARARRTLMRSISFTESACVILGIGSVLVGLALAFHADGRTGAHLYAGAGVLVVVLGAAFAVLLSLAAAYAAWRVRVTEAARP